jgi:hypothetical protein
MRMVALVFDLIEKSLRYRDRVKFTQVMIFSQPLNDFQFSDKQLSYISDNRKRLFAELRSAFRLMR